MAADTWEREEAAARAPTENAARAIEDFVQRAEHPDDVRHGARMFHIATRRRFSHRLDSEPGDPDVVAACELHLRRAALRAVRSQRERPADELHDFACPAWFDWWEAWQAALAWAERQAEEWGSGGDVDLSWLTGAPPSKKRRARRPSRAMPSPLTAAQRGCVSAAAEAWRAFPADPAETDADFELAETLRASAVEFGVQPTRGMWKALRRALGHDDQAGDDNPGS